MKKTNGEAYRESADYVEGHCSRVPYFLLQIDCNESADRIKSILVVMAGVINVVRHRYDDEMTRLIGLGAT